MDVFQIDTSSISSTMVDPETSVNDEITEVKFEAHSEFDLNFFDTPDDSMTQAAFSNPNSVESSTSPTPEPILPLTPNLIQHSITSSNVTINQHQHQNMAQPAMINVKNVITKRRKLSSFSSHHSSKQRAITCQ
ncbi:CLUMA_CG016119, isoform A [Clunio marinus]|uniref:CLUMA_CG016119, isoform A n=1 Tax=Clunio marinus TaxID=568069 RepID=A0A1J1IRU8_9DIPT|nr:CLUMA_CG016119, isoform A [Clunio marinus]